MSDISRRWRWGLVKSNWGRSIHQSAIAGECDACLPVVEACGAIGVYAGGEGELDAGD